MQHAQEEPVPPSHRTELHIPREIDEFVLACLRKDPKRRPASAEELLQMASACKTADLWDQGTARKWWEAHLPHLAMPASLADSNPTERCHHAASFGRVQLRVACRKKDKGRQSGRPGQ